MRTKFNWAFKAVLNVSFISIICLLPLAAQAAHPRPIRRPSANGTMIPPATEILDDSLAVWTVKSGVVYKSGKKAGYSADVTKLVFENGVIYQENSAGLTWSWSGSAWVSAKNPVPSSSPSPSPSVSLLPVSANGTTIPSATQIVDSGHNVWTIVGGVVYENKKTAGYSANVVKLLFDDGVIYQKNAAGLYWSWTNGAWVSASNLSPSPSPSPSKAPSPPPSPSVPAPKPSVTATATPTPTLTSSSGGPVAPTNFQMVGQGQNSVALTWSAAVAGASPISHYNIYRNGSLVGSSTSTSYTDNGATNVTTPGYAPSFPATSYTYALTAVDSAGRESAQASQLAMWVYNNGVDYWGAAANGADSPAFGVLDYNYGDVTLFYKDTQGAPENGSYDIAINTSGNSGWQPFSGAPFLTAAPNIWAMDTSAFNYMTIDLKPTRAGQTWALNFISRVIPGDEYNSASVILGGTDQTFGPTAKAGVWATYKIPFLVGSAQVNNGKSLQVGTGTIQASISGTTMSVSKLISGINVQGGSWISGPGIPVGSFITSTSGSNGGPGNYQVCGPGTYTSSSQCNPVGNIGSTTITVHRTNMYKFSLTDPSQDSNITYYVDKIGFLAQ